MEFVHEQETTPQPTNLSALTGMTFALEKHMKTDGRPWGMDLINDRLFVCEGVNGVNVYNKDFTHERSITLLPSYENFVYDVTVLGDGNIVVAAMDGLFLLTDKGDPLQQIASQRHGSVTHDPQTYDNVYAIIHDVTPLTDESTCRIMKYRPMLRDPSKRWESIQSINLPCQNSKHNVTVTATFDTIYAACEEDNKIYSFDKPSGDKLITYRSYGDSISSVCKAPRVSQSDWAGAFLVCDKEHGRIVLFVPGRGWVVVKVEGLIQHPQCALYDGDKLYVVDRHEYLCVYSKI